MAIGRDLVRLLQHVARVPEFELLWRDILHNPKTLLPTFTGLSQLMQIRTSRRFLFLRLTPDMEKKMIFLTSSVRFGNQKRYQDWFQRQYLSTPESQSLRCDLIRFIVGVIHPSNEVLCSDIIPRWAVLGWLLTTCTHPVAAANAKMALFYDWLFYDAERDNIMNIGKFPYPPSCFSACIHVTFSYRTRHISHVPFDETASCYYSYLVGFSLSRKLLQD